MSRRIRVSGLGALAVLALLAGCVSIPTSGGVTTTEVQAEDPDNPLLSLPASPTKDATPGEIVADFLLAGRGPQDNYKVAREYLTDEFKSKWSPFARTLVTSTTISPVALADNTFSVSISASASIDAQGRYQTAAPADGFDLTFGLVQNDDGQWRISSAPDGTVLSPSRFAAIFDPFELYFYDPSFRYLVPDLRWFRAGATAAGTVVDALLAGPSDRVGSGVLFSAFPTDTERPRNEKVTISAGVATVPLSSDVSAGGATTHRRMQEQLLATLRSVSSVREVDITVNDFTMQIPDGGTPPESTYLVGNDPIGGVEGRIGVLSADGITAISGIGRGADDLAATGASIVSSSRSAIAVRGAGGISVVRSGVAPVVLDARSGLLPPSLDPLGYTWSVPASSPGALLAFGKDGTAYPVRGLPSDARVISMDVSRDGARLLVGLTTAGGPHLLVLGIQRDADLNPTGLVSAVELPIGGVVLTDAAWIDGVTVVALTDGIAVDTYDIGGQHSSLGTVAGGVQIVGGNGPDGTRVLDDTGNVLRPGGGTSWQDTGIDASFLASQQ